MSSRNLFIDMNTEAVALMQSGNNNGASKLLRKILVGLKDDLKPTTDKRLAPLDADMDLEEEHLQSAAVFDAFMNLSDASQDTIFTFYPRAFTLAQTRENQADNSRTAVVVLYNMAVLHHSQALLAKTKRGQVDGQLLSQARDFYQAAQKIAHTSWTGQENLQDMYCILLALTNNLGHVYGQCRTCIYDFDQMNRCLTYMVQLVSYPSLTHFVGDEDSEFFYLSIFTFLDSNTGLTISPAA